MYLEVPNAPGIFVPADGSGVYRRKRGEYIRLAELPSRGYRRVWVAWRGRKANMVAVHLLVYEAWRGPITEGWEVHHLDRNKMNCAADNLLCESRGDHARRHFPEKRAKMAKRREESIHCRIKIELMRDSSGRFVSMARINAAFSVTF